MRKYVLAVIFSLFYMTVGYSETNLNKQTVMHVPDPFMDILTENREYIGLILKDKNRKVYISECLKEKKIVGVYSSTEEAYKAIVKNCGI